MSQAAKKRSTTEAEPVRVLGRGLRAARGVHMTLRTLRDAVGSTQTTVAEQSQIDQADISRLENRNTFEDCQVDTLQRYILALGGSLELVARFGDKRITLVGVERVNPAPKPTNKRLNATGPKKRRS